MSVNSYDSLPYYCLAQPLAHPLHMASIARLYGLKTPAVEQCRFLELGCGDGTHALAVAQGLPGARVYALDASERQIALGEARRQRLGLDNLTLACQDLLDFEPPGKGFDFIVAHGVYSWVAPPVREKILTICREALSDRGVAYISYNTRPGWNLRGTTRDMLIYHTRRFSRLETRLEQMRAWLNFFQEVNEDKQTDYHLTLREEIDFFSSLPDNYLFHEFLEEYNQPEYFYQFMNQAERQGLRYLGDASPRDSFRRLELPPELRHAGETGRIQNEQYLDFLENSQFRQTLLCRAECESWEVPSPSASFQDFRFISGLRPLVDEVALEPGVEQTFDGPAATITEDDPVAKAALFHLAGRGGMGEDYRALSRAVAEHLERAGLELSDLGEALAESLFRYYRSGAIKALLDPPAFPPKPGQYPVASPLARLQIEEGWESLSNLFAEQVSLGPVAYKLLYYLDGEHDAQGLGEIMQQWVAEGLLRPPPEAMRDGRLEPAVLSRQIDSLLRHFAGQGLLLDSRGGAKHGVD